MKPLPTSLGDRFSTTHVVTFALLLFALFSVGARAETVFLPSNGDWHQPSNWSSGVPSAEVNARIDAGKTVSINQAASAGMLSMFPGSRMEVNAHLTTASLRLGVGPGAQAVVLSTGDGDLTSNGPVEIGVNGGSAHLTLSGTELASPAEPITLGHSASRLVIEADARVNTAGLASAVPDAVALVQVNGGTLETAGESTDFLELSPDQLLIGANGLTIHVPADSAAISYAFGAGTLSKTGNGSLVLGGNSNLTAVNVSGGTIQVGTGGTSGSTGTGPVALGAGTLLRFNRSDSFSHRGVISGAGGVRQSGSGTLIFTENHPFTGLTTIDPGATLQLGNASGGATGALGAGDIANEGVLIWDRGGVSTLVGKISGSGSLIKRGGGTYIVEGNNEPADGASVTIEAGALQFGSDRIGGVSGAPGAVPIENHATLIINRSNAVSIDGPITGDGTLIKRGASSFTIEAPVTSAAVQLEGGDMVVNAPVTADTMNIPAGRTVTVNPSGDLIVAALNHAGSIILEQPSGSRGFGAWLDGNGTLEKRGAGSLVIDPGQFGSGAVSATGTLIFDHADDVVLTTPLTAGPIIKRGPGRLELGSSASVGSRRIEGGILAVGGGNITIAEGGTLSPTGTMGTIYLEEGSGIDLGSTSGPLAVSSLEHNLDNDGALERVQTTFTFDLGAPGDPLNDRLDESGFRFVVPPYRVNVRALSGFGPGTYPLLRWDYQDPASLVFSPVFMGTMPPGYVYRFEYEGDGLYLHVNAPDVMVTDLVEINQPEDLPPGSIILIEGGTLRINTSLTLDADLLGVGGTGSRLEVGAGHTVTLEGALLGSAPLALGGAGTLRVGAEFDLFSGIFRHEGAILEMEDPNWLPAGYVADGGTLRLTNASGVSSLHPLELDPNGIRIDIAAGDVLWLADLSGPGSLRKTGPGKLILSGAKTYLGNTYVEEGTFELQGALGDFDLASPLIENTGTLVYNYSASNHTIRPEWRGSGKFVLSDGNAQFEFAYLRDLLLEGHIEAAGVRLRLGSPENFVRFAVAYIERGNYILYTHGELNLGAKGTIFLEQRGESPLLRISGLSENTSLYDSHLANRVILDNISLSYPTFSPGARIEGHFDLRAVDEFPEGVVIAPGGDEAGVMNASYVYGIDFAYSYPLVNNPRLELTLGDPREGVFDQIRSGHILWFNSGLVFDVRPQPGFRPGRFPVVRIDDGGGISAPEPIAWINGSVSSEEYSVHFDMDSPLFRESNGVWTTEIDLIVVPKAYEAWADTQGLTGEDRRWTAKVQGSHLPNFARFIFGLGHAPTTEGELPESSVQEIDGQRYAVFSYRLLEAGRLFQPEVVFSEDLINEGEVVVHGQNGAIIEEDTDHYAPGLHRVRVHVPVAAENRTGFFRLRVASDLPD